MQESSCQLSYAFITLFAMLIPIAAHGCSQPAKSPGTAALTEDARQRVLADLNRREDFDDAATAFGVLALSNGGAVGWVSATSVQGDAFVASYDSRQKLRSSRRTLPLLSCTRLNIRGVGDSVVFVERASGTGLHGETLYIADPNDLVHDYWSGEVSWWEEGLEGRNAGRRSERGLFLADLNSDGVDEIVTCGISMPDVETEAMPSERTAATCEVWFFNAKTRRYESRSSLNGVRTIHLRQRSDDQVIVRSDPAANN